MSEKTAVLKEVELENGQMLILRKPRSDDAEKMIEYLNKVGGESDNLLFGEGEFHLTVEQEREYIQKVSADTGVHFIVAFIGNELVGVGHIGRLARTRNNHNAELSITVRKAHWGLGIGKSMMEEMIRFAQQHKSIYNVHLGVKASNINAIRMYEKFGFDKIGTHKNYFNVNGTFDDEILMDLNMGEMEAGK